MEEGLSGLVELVTVSRTVHARIATWVVNKTSKELLQGGYIAVAFFATGAFVVGAFHLLVLLILLDFVTLSISSDNAHGSPVPQRWEVLPLFVVGALVGICGLVESLGLLYLALNHLGYAADAPELHTFAFLNNLLFCSGNVLLNPWCAARSSLSSIGEPTFVVSTARLNRSRFVVGEGNV